MVKPLRSRRSDSNVEIEVTFGFICLLSLGYIIMGFAMTVGMIVSAAVHELAHAVASELVGSKIKKIRFSAVGAEMIAETSLLSYGKELFCIVSGPMSNFVYGTMLSLLSESEIGEIFAGINLLMALFNLVPANGFDGGRLVALFFPKAAPAVSLVTFCLLGLLSFMALRGFRAITLFIFTLYIPGIILYYITVDKSRRYSNGQKNRRNIASCTKTRKIYGR